MDTGQSKRITIDPITRLEGHGKIEIFLDENGNVSNAYFQVPELRGFEQFSRGRLVEDMPNITNRICGVCPEAHHMAATKALDDLYGVAPSSAARKIRELLYMAFYVTDHSTHFYALGGPDFILGPDAPPAERNILGVVHKVGLDIGTQVINCRQRNHHIIKVLGGKGIHPTAGLPGGWSKALKEEERVEFLEYAKANIEFALFSLKIFGDIVLKNPVYLDLVLSDSYLHRTYCMGTVDELNRVNFYDGKIRVIDPDGEEFLKYDPRDYLTHIAERIEPWSYLKFPYLKAVGWKGFTDGKDSGVYIASPLSRINASDSMSTPLAQEAYEAFYLAFGNEKTTSGRNRPVHHRLATHWARLIELLNCAERMKELLEDDEITDPNVRKEITTPPKGIGIGSVEAPRGTLTHHYETDERGVITKANLIVGTTNNYAPMAMSVKRAAESFIKNGEVSEGLLNRVEMAFRLYDPCLSCATHQFGKTPLMVTLRDQKTLEIIRTVKRGC